MSGLDRFCNSSKLEEINLRRSSVASTLKRDVKWQSQSVKFAVEGSVAAYYYCLSVANVCEEVV